MIVTDQSPQRGTHTFQGEILLTSEAIKTHGQQTGLGMSEPAGWFGNNTAVTNDQRSEKLGLPGLTTAVFAEDLACEGQLNLQGHSV